MTRTASLRWLCALYLLGAASMHLVANIAATMRGAVYIGLHLLLSGLMFGIWRLGRDGIELRAVMIVGILARALLVPVAPFTTTDVERYLWDGHVALAGADPYSIAPNAAPDALKHDWPLPSMNGDYVTLYPPIAVGAFAACAAFGVAHGRWVWKALVACASIATLLLGADLLRQQRRSRHLALLSLSPLLVLEAGVGAHLDAISVLAMVAALWLGSRGRPWSMGAVIGFGALTKLLPVIGLLTLVDRDARWVRRALSGFVVTWLSGYAVALSLGMKPFGSLATFLRSWRFGSPLHHAVEMLHLSSSWDPWGRTAILIGALSSMGWLLMRRRGQSDIALTRRVIAIALLASPVVFPWYLSPLAALAAFAPSWWLLGWVTAAPLTYEVIDAPTWTPATWPLWAMTTALVAGAALDWLPKLRHVHHRGA